MPHSPENRPYQQQDGTPIRDYMNEHGHIVMYQLYNDELPFSFELADGKQVIRLGESRLPDPLGRGPLEALFIYDPKRIEVETIPIGPDQFVQDHTKQRFESAGYRVTIGLNDTIVAYKERTDSEPTT